MRFIFIFCLFLSLANAVKLISYNIYDRNDRVDLMLSFDSAYNGAISQKQEDGFTLLSFANLQIDKTELKNLNSKLAQKVQISAKNNTTYIMFAHKENVSIDTSSINDKFGIRVRLIASEKATKTALPSSNQTLANTTPLASKTSPNQALATLPNATLPNQVSVNQSLPNSQNQAVANQASQNSPNSEQTTQNEQSILNTKNTALQGYDYTTYVLVMGALILILVLLWWFKRNLGYKNLKGLKNYNVIFAQMLDRHNQFVILEQGAYRYTLVLGSSNLLLDKSEIAQEEASIKPPDRVDKAPVRSLKSEIKKDKTPRSFDSFFEENKRKIQDLIEKRQNLKQE